MVFNQPPPQLGNQYAADWLLRSLLRRKIPQMYLAAIEADLTAMGELAVQLYHTQLADRLNEPSLTQWDGWGQRIDQIDVSPLWKQAQQLAAQHGVVAAAYEPRYGAAARLHQFALAYLFHPSTDVYTCPLAMTDGAARTLLYSGHQALIKRAVPRLTSRDPQTAWTSGQWMTESTGGSDVGRSETRAQQDSDGTWRLYGRKWFTSATTSQMALTLARPAGNPSGGRGLALFYVETRTDAGRLNNIEINRLKDKLGTRKVPTAELMLQGTPAIPVGGLDNGVAQIVPMLHLTRTWNSVMAAATMRRGLALAWDYAQRRIAFEQPLSNQPLHLDTLASQQAEWAAAFQLSFFVVELLGLLETQQATPQQHELFRFLTSLAKLMTGRQAVDVLSEVIEAFGGAGYVEDTGLPLLLRDAHVLPIWEGTTNVLALDTLRAIQRTQGLQALQTCMQQWHTQVRDQSLQHASTTAQVAWQHALTWFQANQADKVRLQAGMRRFALTVARATALALLVEHAQWAYDHNQNEHVAAAARLFAQQPIDYIDDLRSFDDVSALFA